MSRIQDALKKAEQESLATNATVLDNTVVEELQPAAPITKPERQFCEFIFERTLS
jgi:hypothetical protein